MPICTILGGPNGAGKSSLFAALDLPGQFINADQIAKSISPQNPEAASLEAGREVLKRLDRLILDRKDFVYETTLSGNQALNLMRKAKDAKYEIGLIFVILASADLHVLRVADRVTKGGHSIPEEVIRRRYEGALSKLANAISIADATAIFDNTELPAALLLRIRSDRIEENSLDEAKLLHVRIAETIAQTLNIRTDSVIKAANP